MAVNLDLLGVVGTWIAAVLGIIALAGILPVYVLYRQTQTERHIALNKVHDPHKTYITAGYPLWLGRRFFRSYSVPNLVDPPTWSQLTVVARRRCEGFGTHVLRSLTGWVNFANVLQIYNIKPAGSKGKLAFARQEALLPVHRGWLLLLGIIDRYSDQMNRPDKGLFVGEAEEAEMDEFGPWAIFGISGVLEHIVASALRQKDVESGPEVVDKVVFRMHSVQHMARVSDSFLRGDDMAILSLVALYLGYLVSVDGKEHYDLETPDTMLTVYTSAHRRDSGEDTSHKIWIWDQKPMDSLPSQQRRLMQELGIKLPRVLKLKEVVAPNQAIFHQMPRDAAQSYQVISHKGKGKAWMTRSSLHTLVLAVLRLNITPQSFLFNNPPLNQDILSHLFYSGNLRTFAETTEKFSRNLDVLTQREKQDLERSLRNLKENAPEDGTWMEWSRTRMDACISLDKLLNEICQKRGKLLCCVISILYMQEDGFRFICNRYRVFDYDDPEVLAKQFMVDLSSKKVLAPLPYIEGEPEFEQFYFDFPTVFSDAELLDVWPSPMNRYPVPISLPLAMIACLRGHLRMAMWDMRLNSSPLADFYRTLRSGIVHIVPQEMPPPGSLSTEFFPPPRTSPPPLPVPPEEPVVRFAHYERGSTYDTYQDSRASSSDYEPRRRRVDRWMRTYVESVYSSIILSPEGHAEDGYVTAPEEDADDEVTVVIRKKPLPPPLPENYAPSSSASSQHADPAILSHDEDPKCAVRLSVLRNLLTEDEAVRVKALEDIERSIDRQRKEWQTHAAIIMPSKYREDRERALAYALDREYPTTRSGQRRPYRGFPSDGPKRRSGSHRGGKQKDAASMGILDQRNKGITEEVVRGVVGTTRRHRKEDKSLQFDDIPVRARR
ncbi:uncharacterized protein P174DRAFT_503380 [Aspergillus novofumigatus IBT 16806]|uniref:Uncharacterized protein n=1 Tax=Aspergillus novofumigatus (strain IBT 16806) TaxID=1392255 RepID=A0A2I1CF20_ASPN1|nr:uncharacterized protein P174DRAFT_503380 [Aspergillus novofumigatus IBT 16806]PKX96201.1 hypothetical protein P174DRAFT_503380 [Aspergillus novofumigatus IBT 16806]